MLTVDLDRGCVVHWPGGRAVETLRWKRRTVTALPVQFVRGGRIVAVGAGAELGTFALKPVGRYAAAYVTSAESWSIVAGPPPRYRFHLSLNTPAIQALFAPRPVSPWLARLAAEHPEWELPTTPEPPAAVTLMGELRWIDEAGEAHNTLTFAVEVENWLIDDSTALLGMLSWPAINRLTGGTATDLDRQPTAGLYPYGTPVAMVNVLDPATGQPLNAGGLTVWCWTENAAAVLAYGVVVPLDFNAVTNPGCWVKVL